MDARITIDYDMFRHCPGLSDCSASVVERMSVFKCTSLQSFLEAEDVYIVHSPASRLEMLLLRGAQNYKESVLCNFEKWPKRSLL